MTEILNFRANYNSRLAQIVAESAEFLLLLWEEELLEYLSECESPIEEYFLAALYADKDLNPYEISFCKTRPVSDSPCGECIYVHQQAEIGRYRADFLIHDCSIPLELEKPGFIVVECDGHQHHERTPQQAAHDKRRDRYFQSLGYKVLRFTGSELYQDPTACVYEVLEQLATNRQPDWRKRLAQ